MYLTIIISVKTNIGCLKTNQKKNYLQITEKYRDLYCFKCIVYPFHIFFKNPLNIKFFTYHFYDYEEDSFSRNCFLRSSGSQQFVHQRRDKRSEIDEN